MSMSESDPASNSSSRGHDRQRNSRNSRNRTTQGKRQSQSHSANEEPAPSDLKPGDVEFEFGVPIAGTILPPEQWARTALKRLPDDGPIDFAALFGRRAPLVLDIGCGNGRYLLSSAVNRPDLDHIGIDTLPMVIRYATRRANMRGLSNTRWAASDGHKFLGQHSRPAQYREIHIYHPQPYQDDHSHHLRLFDHAFLWLLHQALEPAGKLIVQTDNAAYWQYLQQVLPSITQWHEQAGPWPDEPQIRSRRQIVAQQKGLKVYRGWGIRREDVDEASFQLACANLPHPTFHARHNRNPRRWRRKP